jgi:hypothetical protein
MPEDWGGSDAGLDAQQRVSRTTLRLAYDAVTCVILAATFVLLAISAHESYGAAEPFDFALYMSLIGLGCISIVVGALYELSRPSSAAVLGEDSLPRCLVVAALIFPGAFLAPLLPLAALCWRCFAGGEHDARDGGERRSDLAREQLAARDRLLRACPTQAAADVLWVPPADRHDLGVWAPHQRLLHSAFFFELVAFGVMNFLAHRRHAMVDATLVLATLNLALPLYQNAVANGDAAVRLCVYAASLHDALSFLYVAGLLSGALQPRADLWRADVLLVAYCCAATAAWLFVAGCGIAVSWAARNWRRPASCEREDAALHVVSAAVAIAFLPLGVAAACVAHVGAKGLVCKQLVDASVGYTGKARAPSACSPFLRDAWRFCGRGLRTGKRAADGEYAERLRHVSVMALQQCYDTDAAVRAVVCAPSEHARDGAAHGELPRIADDVVRGRALCYAAVWGALRRPVFDYDSLVDLCERVECITGFSGACEDGTPRPALADVWPTRQFTQRLALHGPPMVLWALLPVVVVATNWRAMTAPHAVLIALLLGTLAAAALLSQPVAPHIRFNLAVAPLRMLLRGAQNNEAVSGAGEPPVAQWVAAYYAVRPADYLRAVVPRGVLPMAVLRDHVEPLLEPSGHAEFSVGDCETIRQLGRD